MNQTERTKIISFYMQAVQCREEGLTFWERLGRGSGFVDATLLALLSKSVNASFEGNSHIHPRELREDLASRCNLVSEASVLGFMGNPEVFGLESQMRAHNR